MTRHHQQGYGYKMLSTGYIFRTSFRSVVIWSKYSDFLANVLTVIRATSLRNIHEVAAPTLFEASKHRQQGYLSVCIPYQLSTHPHKCRKPVSIGLMWMWNHLLIGSIFLLIMSATSRWQVVHGTKRWSCKTKLIIWGNFRTVWKTKITTGNKVLHWCITCTCTPSLPDESIHEQ